MSAKYIALPSGSAEGELPAAMQLPRKVEASSAATALGALRKDEVLYVRVDPPGEAS